MSGGRKEKLSFADGSGQPAGDEATPESRTEFDRQKKVQGEEITVMVTSLPLVAALFLFINETSAVAPRAA